MLSDAVAFLYKIRRFFDLTASTIHSRMYMYTFGVHMTGVATLLSRFS